MKRSKMMARSMVLFGIAAMAVACKDGDAPPNDPLSVLWCDDGFVFIASSTNGTTGICVKRENLLIHGLVTDNNTGAALVGVTVTMFPDNKTTQTDANGYFAFKGPSQINEAVLIYTLAGYSTQTQTGVNGNATGVGDYVYDASMDMSPSGATWTVAGTVYAGDIPASGAVVELRRGNTPAYQGTTDAAGHFSFANVPGLISYTLTILPFDRDADGILDYTRQTLNLGTPETFTAQNLSNLVIGLPAMTKALVYANFVPVPNQVTTANTTRSGLRFTNPTSNFIFHFGAEVNPAKFSARMRKCEGSCSANETAPNPDAVNPDMVAINTAWSNQNTVLTIDPTTDLVADADSHTQYEIRFDTLVWADGEVLLSEASATDYITYVFDVASANTPLSSPTPRLYFANKADANQTTTQVQCDADVCWLLDANNHWYQGYADSFSGGSIAPAFNQASGVQLTWDVVPGAEYYNLYVRHRSTNNNAHNLNSWYWNAQVAGAMGDPNLNEVFTGSALNGAGQGAFGFFDITGWGPLAWGDELDIAVTSVDVDGFESPITAANALTLSDTMVAQLRGAQYNVAGSGVQANATETGHVGIKQNMRLYFSEAMDVDFNPEVVAHSGNITRWVNASTFSWGGTGQTPANAEDDVLAGAYTFDIRGACVPVTCNATFNAVENSKSSNSICVKDTTPFTTGNIFFVSSAGANLHTGTLTINAVDRTNNIITFNSTVQNNINASTTNFACAANAGAGKVTSLQQPTLATDTVLNVTDASMFFAGQTIMAYDTSNGTFTTASVSYVRVGSVGELTLSGLIGAVFTTQSVVMPLPTGTEYAFRQLSQPTLTATKTATSSIDIVSNSGLSGLNVMIGDLAMIDLDGKINTVNDRYFGTVTDVFMRADDGATATTDETDFHVTVGAPPAGAGMTALPSGSVVKHNIALVYFLGDSFRIANADSASASGMLDTSGNKGVSTLRDQFTQCTAEPGCLSLAGGNFFMF